MSRTAAILIEAGKIIADPAQWTQGALARDKSGNDAKPNARGAVRFSAEGIICKVLRWNPEKDDERNLRIVGISGPALATLDLMANRQHRHSSFYVNDVLGHSETMEMFRAAVRYARASGRSHK